jgi:tRNA(Ile)-lysidine synthase
MALLHVMARLAKRLEIVVYAHGVDHGLRAAAKAELDTAERFASDLGISFARSELSVPTGGNLQARARCYRYDALRQAARSLGARYIATAHHADDRAETVLIQLMRGAGPRGLGVLAPQDGDLIRPFIRATRVDIMQHLQRHKIPFAEDPSNKDTRFLRVRIRNEVLPMLVAVAPGLVAHLNALADRMLGLDKSDPHLPKGLSQAKVKELYRMVSIKRDGAEIALSEGWVLRLERRRINAFSG